MKIIADSGIPFLKGVLEKYAEVEYVGGKEIDNQIIRNADIIIIRTRTKCNAQLLHDTHVKLIVTATIGTDHIDLDYCNNNRITVHNAAGCNSGGVMQYVYTTLFKVAQDKGIQLNRYNKDFDQDRSKCSIGIIGVGHVGGKVASLGEYLGFEVLRNDPQKEREQTLAFNNGYLNVDDFKNFYSLEYLLKNSDIVTLHVPLDASTREMASDSFFCQMKPGAIFINSSRGEVVDEQSLLNYSDKFSGIICDVWNHEPEINRQLLCRADIATPHFAGYSLEGKVNGTQMSIRSIGKYLDIKELTNYTVPVNDPFKYTLDLKDCTDKTIAQVLNNIFPVGDMDAALRANPSEFEYLRNNYNYRREFYVK